MHKPQDPEKYERRKWARLPYGTDKIEVEKGGRTGRAEGLHQSIGGAEILVKDAPFAKVNEELDVLCEGTSRRGLVRWMRPETGAGYRMGIAWLDVLCSLSAYSTESANYLLVDGLLVVCQQEHLFFVTR